MATYNSIQAFKIARHFQFKNGVNIEAQTGHRVLTYADSMMQILTPDGGHNLTLPAEKNGGVFMIKNADGSNNLHVKNPAAATVQTLAAGETGIFVCDGTAWALMLKA